MLTIKNILVATDFSECSDAALDYGRALARVFGARIHLVHVMEMLAADTFAAGYVVTIPEERAEMEAVVRKQLEETLSADDRRLLGAKAVLVSMDTSAHGIVNYAESEPIDLIVMGTHGRRALAHMLMGSVAEKVVRTAPCPVLTVRHPRQEAVVGEAATIGVATTR